MSIMSTETIVSPAPLKTGGEITFKTNILPDLKDITPADGQAHYVRKDSLREPGKICVALCGKRWIPQHRNPSMDLHLPTCEPCAALLAILEQENN